MKIVNPRLGRLCETLSNIAGLMSDAIIENDFEEAKYWQSVGKKLEEKIKKEKLLINIHFNLN